MIKERYNRALFPTGTPKKELAVSTKPDKNGNKEAGICIMPDFVKLPQDKWADYLDYKVEDNGLPIIHALALRQIETDGMNYVRPMLRVTDADRQTRSILERVKKGTMSDAKRAAIQAILDADEAAELKVKS